MKNQLSIPSILLLLATFGHAQSPYQLKPKKEIAFIGTGLAVGGAAFYFGQKLDVLTTAQINSLQNKGISPFEEWTTMQGSDKSDKVSDILLTSSQFFPVILTLADKKMRKDYLKIGTLYSEVFLLNLGLTAFAKNTVRRARPYVYDPDHPIEEKMLTSARKSFYSGHTSETAAMCFLSARLFADYHPNSKWKPVVWTAAATIPAATGYFRMRAGKHFPSDVLVGYLTGAAIGYFLPKVHLKRRHSKF